MLYDAFMCAMWITTNILLFHFYWQLCRRLYVSDHSIQLVGHNVLAVYATIVIVGALLGSVNLLIPWLYITILLIFGLLGLVTTFRLPHPVKLKKDEDSIGEGWLAVWGVVAACWLCHVAINGLLTFPSDWDTLVYHLPFTEHWINSWSIYTLDNRSWSQPANNELFALWLTFPFSGDFLSCTNNLPAVALLTCGTLEVGRWLGLSSPLQHITTLIIITTYPLHKQLFDSENDIICTGLAMTCLGYIFRYIADGRRVNLLLGVISLGLLSGVKYYALAYVGMLAIVAILLIVRNRGWGFVGPAAISGLVGICAFGGYWYFRNILITGAPLFPLGARTAGPSDLLVHPNLIPALGNLDLWRSTFIGNGSPGLFELGLRAIWRVSGPCHLISFVGVPITLLWLAFSGDKIAQQDIRGIRSAFAIGIIIAIGAWLVTPYAVEDVAGTLNQVHMGYCPVRYGLIPLSMTVLGAAVVVSDLARLLTQHARCVLGGVGNPETGEWAVGSILIAALLYQQHRLTLEYTLAMQWDTIIAGAILFAFIYSCISIIEILSQRYRWQTAFMTSLVVSIASMCSTYYLSQKWHSLYTSYYDSTLGDGIFKYMSDNIPTDSPIIVMYDRYYPFFGSSRQYHIIQVRDSVSFAQLMSFIDSTKTRYIVLSSSFEKDNKTIDTIHRRTDLFQLLPSQSNNFEIYKINNLDLRHNRE